MCVQTDGAVCCCLSTEAGAGEELPSLQQCQEVANELRQTARRAVHLYQQVRYSLCSLFGWISCSVQFSTVQFSHDNFCEPHPTIEKNDFCFFFYM